MWIPLLYHTTFGEFDAHEVKDIKKKNIVENDRKWR